MQSNFKGYNSWNISRLLIRTTWDKSHRGYRDLHKKKRSEECDDICSFGGDSPPIKVAREL